VHALAALQDTASRALCVPATGTGTCWVLQAVPFHDSASAEVPALVSDDPTAMHRFVPGQASAASVPFATTASGVPSMDHAAPVPAQAGAPDPAICPVSVVAAPRRIAALQRKSGTAEAFQPPAPQPTHGDPKSAQTTPHP
jgi:hypothetical protein